jgi:hypothetical protein
MVASTGADRVALELMMEEIKTQAPEELVLASIGWGLTFDREVIDSIWGINNFWAVNKWR